MKTQEVIEWFVAIANDRDDDSHGTKAIEHAIRIMRESEWRPIEDIKEDMRHMECLVWLNPMGGYGHPYWSIRKCTYDGHYGGKRRFIEWGKDDYYPKDVVDRITHWKPLPKGPEE